MDLQGTAYRSTMSRCIGASLDSNLFCARHATPSTHLAACRRFPAAALQPTGWIEITESVLLDGETSVVALLHRLRKMGMALDDFGTGYSSLSDLRSFPFDKIKIDRSFMIGVAHDPCAAAIVHAIDELLCRVFANAA